MYSVQKINLYFGSLHLLDDVGFTISPGEKVALLGRNGAGKTTLFKILNGELSPDGGEIVIPKNSRIGYLSQHFDLDESKGILESCMECFGDYLAIEHQIQERNILLTTVTDEDKVNKILNEIAELEIQKSTSEVSNPEAEASKILKGFGFRTEQLSEPINTLSGGWKMRVQMSKLLLSKPDLLLLDEPDNHLDIEALIWFEKYLKAYTGALLFITHDEQFMSNVADRVIELSNRRVHVYNMNYRRYLGEKDLRKEKELQAYKNQQKVIKDKERTITRFMAKESKTKMAQSMKKQLDKMQRIEIETEDQTHLNIQFKTVGAPGKVVVTTKELYKSYGDLSVLEKIDLEILRGQKVAFVGQNGQGKSTLVKIIAGVTPSSKGSAELGYNVDLKYFAQNQSDVLDVKKTVLETIEDEADPEYKTACRKTLGAFAFSGDDVYKKVSVLSGGERSRLAMACLVSQKSNFLILDEPTNHLDLASKRMLKQAIIDYPGTLIIVSHDREILKGSVDITYEFRDRKVIQHLGDLEYVLEKRKSDDLRSFELSNKSQKSDKKKTKPKLSYEENKKINRRISKLEKEITKLESEISGINEKLIDPAFYNSPDAAPALKDLKAKETRMEEATEEWEEWVSKLEG